MPDDLTRHLFESESDYFDFKREQYRFTKATDNEKSELLKDILTFANAWRRTDAYILLGVEEIPGQKAIVHGITEHLNDSHLQQFVNSKTNRIVHFAYQTHILEDKSVARILIPLQERPVFLKADYGKLTANTVYLRRGTSTGVATGDEVIQMMAANPALRSLPSVEVQFADAQKRSCLGVSRNLVSKLLKLPERESIPLLPDEKYRFPIQPSPMPKNLHMLRDVADYYYYKSLLNPVSIFLKNTGNIPTENLKLTLTISRHPALLVRRAFPEEPSAYSLPTFTNDTRFPDDTLSLDTFPSHYLITIPVGTLQPKAEFWSEEFYVGSETTDTFQVQSTLFGNNLPDPIHSLLTIQVQTTGEHLSLDDLKHLARKQQFDAV